MPAPRRLDKPLPLTKQLATHARVRPVNNKVGVGTYYHSAQLLLRQVICVHLGRPVCAFLESFTQSDALAALF